VGTKIKIDLIGISQNIAKIRKLTDQVADTDLNIVVYGETGVGKEVVVRSLYEKSKRCGKPFVKVNCAALPDTLLESEMFGYERGAFTGAQKKMRGKFEQADSGVLFLDEIGDMPLALQSKLLHALQDGDFTPLGSEKLISTDVWVIADLYHRLNEIKIYIEPLRYRPEDIPLLIDYFTKKYHSRLNGKPLRILSKGILEKLINYHWPGNVRELQNILKRIIVLGDGEGSIDEILKERGGETSTIPVETIVNRISIPTHLLDIDDEKQLDRVSMSLKKIKRETRNRVDKEMISYALRKTHWNRVKAAKMLNVSYKFLYNKIDELNISPAL
jgi:transcriptional regulator with GAF, ATPase, and Fis domain